MKNIKKNPIDLKLLELGDCQFGLSKEGYCGVWEKEFKENQNTILKDAIMRAAIELTMQGDKNMSFYYRKKF